MKYGKPIFDQSKLKITSDKKYFPISWLNTQGFCEYCIKLEYHDEIKVGPTKAMLKGTEEHSALEAKFLEEAEETTFEEMMESSKTAEMLSREMWVESERYGIRGYIDEIWMTPDEFVIIDDKPGQRAYSSTINQVYGYCLAFKDIINDERRIVASLRQRGTDNIFWAAPFDTRVERATIGLVERVHRLLEGEEEFIPTKNPNKCRSCRFKTHCDMKCEF